MFFGTPPGGMGDSNAAGGGGSGFSMGFGAAESTSAPPTTSMSKKLGNSGPFGGLFEKGGVFNRPAPFVNQPAFFGDDSASFFTDKHLAGSDDKGGQIEDVKAGNSFYRSGTRKPTLYDADSISAWMAGKVERPTLGRTGQRENRTIFFGLPKVYLCQYQGAETKCFGFVTINYVDCWEKKFINKLTN
jgi:hypothetical protein